MKSILFAEDTNLFYAGKDLNEVCELVSRELNILHMWFNVNKLSLNVAKTNFIIICTKPVTCRRKHKLSFSYVQKEEKMGFNLVQTTFTYDN